MTASNTKWWTQADRWTLVWTHVSSLSLEHLEHLEQKSMGHLLGKSFQRRRIDCSANVNMDWGRVPAGSSHARNPRDLVVIVGIWTGRRWSGQTARPGRRDRGGCLRTGGAMKGNALGSRGRQTYGLGVHCRTRRTCRTCCKTCNCRLQTAATRSQLVLANPT